MKTRFPRNARTITPTLIVVLASLLLTSCFRLDSFLFVPTRLTKYQLEDYPCLYSQEVNALLPDSAIDTIEAVSFPSGSETLYGFRLRHQTYGGVTILYNHGNEYSIDIYWPRVKMLYLIGYDVFVYDYRGFGMSTGASTGESLQTDGVNAVAYLASQGVPASQILIYGLSMGSIPAVYEAAEVSGLEQAVGLVLEAPLGSAAIFVQDGTQLPLPASIVTNLTFDNVALAPNAKMPLLWLHGDQDRTARYDTHGQAIYDAYGGATKYKFIVHGAGHGDVPLMLGGPDFSVFINIIADFAAGKVPHT